MLPKINRLPGHLIPKTLKSKNTLYSPLFNLKLQKTDRVRPCQISFIVSAKIIKLAVQRNKLKRQLKTAIYPHLKNLKPNYNLIFLVKHPIKQASFNQIKTTFINLLSKAKLISNEKPNS
ncbi:MAG: ribonuclease P protein component [Patescibacteria group bacterium]|nr:ribonuclease P protein component [Patescibacteria group bacterium]